MRIIGTGIDIIACSRIAHMIRDHGEGFLRRVYTPREVAYCQGRNREVEHFAGRWAAKEAVLKALGTGWAKGIAFTDVEIERRPAGNPRVILHAEAARRAAEVGIETIHISLSHCEAYATAQAIAEGPD